MDTPGDGPFYDGADNKQESEVLMALCDGKSARFDKIAECFTSGTPALAATLMLLEMKGRVRRLPGATFERIEVRAEPQADLLAAELAFVAESDDIAFEQSITALCATNPYM